MYFDLTETEPKKEELRNLRSSRETLFINAFERFRRSLRLLICLAIKNYFVFFIIYIDIFVIKRTK